MFYCGEKVLVGLYIYILSFKDHHTFMHLVIYNSNVNNAKLILLLDDLPGVDNSDLKLKFRTCYCR